jgi:Dipeptidyl aminopeptidases/acylaminoacyl-peptidases
MPGELLEASALEIIPASEAGKTLRLAAPFLLGTQIKMDLLAREGYAAWRQGRLSSMGDVQGVRISFNARLPEGGVERQSGMLYLPAPRPGETRELSWIIFLKGTELLRDYTPSRGKGNELPFVQSAAALGYAVWMPDYSGMGDGAGVHEYCVAESLADSALDGLAAARAWLEATNRDGIQPYRESGRLAVMGYSEGGLAAMGTIVALAERRIETPGLDLEVAYPMGAPLNLGIGVPRLGPEPSVFNRPDYQVFLALGWVRAFPDKLKLGDIFLPRTIERIVPLFDGKTSGEDLCREIAAIVGKKDGSVTDSDLFTADYCAALRREPESTAYYKLQLEERLDQWSPPAGLPIVLAASPTDEIVSFQNSQNEYEWARTNAPGSKLELVRLANSTHVKGAMEALLYAFLDLERRESDARAASASAQKSPS